jgi:hypothetical protein
MPDAYSRTPPAIAPQPTGHRWNHETDLTGKKEMGDKGDLVTDIIFAFEKGNGL